MAKNYKKRVLFLDQATKDVGFCVVEIGNNDKPVWLEGSTAKMKYSDPTPKRMLSVCQLIRELTEEYEIDYLVVEDVQIQRKTNLNTTVTLIKLLGVVEVLAAELGKPLSIMNVIQWKNSALIKSKTRDSQKKESIELAMSRFPQFNKDMTEDLADVLNMSVAWLINNNYINRDTLAAAEANKNIRS